MIDFKHLRKLIRQEERLRWAVRRMEDRATRTTPTYSAAPRVGGNGQQMEENVIRLLMVKEQHELIRAELGQARSELQKKMELIPDGVQRAALGMRYIQGMSIREIMQAMNYSERQVFRILEEAESRARRE